MEYSRRLRLSLRRTLWQREHLWGCWGFVASGRSSGGDEPPHSNRLASFRGKLGSSFTASSRPRTFDGVAVDRSSPVETLLTFLGFLHSRKREAVASDFAVHDLRGCCPLARGCGYRTGCLVAIRLEQHLEIDYSILSGRGFFAAVRHHRRFPGAIETGRRRHDRQQEEDDYSRNSHTEDYMTQRS